MPALPAESTEFTPSTRFSNLRAFPVRAVLWSALLASGLMAGCSSSSGAPKAGADDGDAPSGSMTQTPDYTTDELTDGSTDTDTFPVVTSPSHTDGLPAPTVPMLDPFAAPIPGPDPADPFGTMLEIDDEAAVAGGAPTTPKHLRAVLVSNDWAELDWAPSNDDGGVAAYRLYRSDGHVYDIREDDAVANAGAQAEIDKIWATTSFIDCNYTRFLDRLHDCASFGPVPGESYSYQVTAIDEQGQESPRSNTLTVRYHAERGAPVPRYEDFYLNGDDTFAQDHDLSRTADFLDEFKNVFEDEFDLGFIDGTRWNTSLTWGDGNIINGEQQYFVDTQKDPGFGFWPFSFDSSSAADGAPSTLTIRAVPTPDEFRERLPQECHQADLFGVERCAFLSGALSSHDRFGLTYGYVEGRMKVASAAGALSSFYLYNRYAGNDELRHAPEIDIVEYLGENPYGDEDAFLTYHFDDAITGLTRSAPTMHHKLESGDRYDEQFHTYGVLWEPQLVIWYIDGVEIRRMSGPQVARQQMNIVTYLVAGSEWAPTPDKTANIFPLTLEIDWIRAYQRPVFNGNGVYPDQ